MTTKIHPALRGRPGLDVQIGSALSRDLGELARRHGLMGAVLITFVDDRVGVPLAIWWLVHHVQFI